MYQPTFGLVLDCWTNNVCPFGLVSVYFGLVSDYLDFESIKNV